MRLSLKRITVISVLLSCFSASLSFRFWVCLFFLHEDLPKIESCLPVVFNVFKLEVGLHLNDSAAIP